ncbi:multicopper oxidase family protein [Nocardia sp. alder85J]|uniref:multicopper oxidase family protein n=1 Tax=Nocardia sp. alder85J TaxID=2862949 RepID=UPI001CD527BC|nr:multicopper oxidase domain-containing protein [Nocardia sp. alder85J]MCX4091263.1 multicopper oxidase domain-containing protein [Nocardia sp. alder85J]
MTGRAADTAGEGHRASPPDLPGGQRENSSRPDALGEHGSDDQIRAGRRLSRRGVLRGAAVLGAAGALGAWEWSADTPADREHLTSDARLPEPFTLPLVLPPVLAPIARDDTTDYYRIVQRPADIAVLPGYSTPMWTYGGSFPGPTVVSARDRRTVVTHRNELPVPVVVHLHGGHLPEESDGFPTDLLYPAGTPAAAMPDMPGMARDPMAHTAIGERDYVYPAGQPAAALWYHDHRMDFTGAAVWRGLAGFHLVTDESEQRLGLPAGDRDLPLLLADRAFDTTGALKYPAIDPSALHTAGVTGKFTRGALGDVVLVNGVPWPEHRVVTARYRLRLLNGSNARVYRLRLDMPHGDGHFVQIGSDGGLLDRPQRLDEVTIAPGERYDVVVDFGGCAVGDRVTVYNDLGAGTTTRIMRFAVTDRVADTAVIPDTLSGTAPPDPGTAVTTRVFRFGRRDAGSTHGWVINGRPYSPFEPIARPRLGDLEIWRLVTDLDHPIHLHLNQFRVLSRNGGPPLPADAGWKDTLYLTAAQTAEIAVRFTDHAGRYVLHCHNLEHEDMSMMATFTTHT